MKIAFLDIPVIGLLLYFLLSSLFSIDRWASFAGSFGVWHNGFFVFFIQVLWYFFAARFVNLHWIWRFGFLLPILAVFALGFFTKSFTVAFLGLSALLFFHIVRKFQGSGILVAVILFAILGLLGAFPIASIFPLRDSVVDLMNSWGIAFSSLLDSPKNFFFGTGPGTFSLDMARYGSAPSFDGATGFAEILATFGVIGFLLYVAVFVLAFLRFAFLACLQRDRMQGFLGALLFAVFGAYLLSPATFPLLFLFWTLASFARDPSKSSGLAIPKITKPLWKLGIFALAGFVVFLGSRVIVAQAVYQKAKLESNSEKRISLLETAVRVNPYETAYKIQLARLYIEIATVPAIENALLQLQEAVKTGPARSEAWEALGMLYKAIQTAPGAKEWGVKAFETALTLSPKNARLYTELGMLYTEKEELGLAEEYFKKALVLSPGFLDAIFQLGRIYYNDGRVEDAERSFKQVLLLNPDNSNAHYSLGVLYEKEKRKKEAIDEFTKVLELNPGDSNVILKLNQLTH
ncbi:MAG: hypothetical protein Greene101447_259 [Parcubacteria group bacterium Greene1014_47]|nr:MAG: hypothetical protein Greene101447_259 [Parcubacteria group bacterium Greene1014_47]